MESLGFSVFTFPLSLASFSMAPYQWDKLSYRGWYTFPKGSWVETRWPAAMVTIKENSEVTFDQVVWLTKEVLCGSMASSCYFSIWDTFSLIHPDTFHIGPFLGPVAQSIKKQQGPKNNSLVCCLWWGKEKNLTYFCFYLTIIFIVVTLSQGLL